jgi:hypothetical protein
VSDSFGTNGPDGETTPATGPAPAVELPTAPPDSAPVTQMQAAETPVWPPLAGLVETGVITVAQAAAVQQTLLEPDAPPPTPKRPRLLADAALYLGGALVLISVYVFIGSGSGDWGKSTLFAVITGFALVLALVAVLIVSLSETSWSTLKSPGNDATRRLVSVLLTLAVTTFCGALATLPTLNPICFVGFCEQGGSRGSQVLPFLGIAVLEFVLLLGVRLLAPTPFSEFFWFESFVLIAALIAVGWLSSAWAVAGVIGLSGAIWIALCLRTRLIRTRDLGLALGALVVVLAAAGYSTSSGGAWIVIGLVLVVFVVLYLFTAKWQFLMGAALATVIEALRYVTSHFDQSPTTIAITIGVTGGVVALLGLFGYMLLKGRKQTADG